MKSKGITLIALVITIIVLLILAGITINLTIGNQGVITRAQQAATNYKDAEGKEQAELDNFDSEVEDVLEGIDNTEVLPGQISKSTVKNNYTDGTKTATIPKGFTVSGIEDEQHIDTGLVIYDKKK